MDSCYANVTDWLKEIIMPYRTGYIEQLREAFSTKWHREESFVGTSMIDPAISPVLLDFTIDAYILIIVIVALVIIRKICK
jgi:hypothetical protein